MLENANPGGAKRGSCLLWFICILILGSALCFAMKYCSEWSQELYDNNELLNE